MLRLVGALIGVIAVVIILAFGEQQLGLPIVSMLTGLGIGGLAVALAIRPTLENLIGGVILYVDKPVRAGDFCGYGEKRREINASPKCRLNGRSRDNERTGASQRLAPFR